MLIVGVNPRGAAGMVSVNEAGAADRIGQSETLTPTDRSVAVYRLTRVDSARTAQLYHTNADFHQAFNAAYQNAMRVRP
jgi:hypothetical protein